MAYAKAVTDDEILSAFNDVHGPIVTVPDLAERIDMSADGIRIRLKNLEAEGLVESKQVGARAVVWWRTDQ